MKTCDACFQQADSAISHDQSSDDARLKLYVGGKEVVHFPLTVHGNELLQVETSFPAG